MERPTKATSIPSEANANAVAFPIPLLAPVIKARSFCSTLTHRLHIFWSCYCIVTQIHDENFLVWAN